MAKKVKCKNCLNATSWAYPKNISSENYEYAKDCLNTIKSTICCADSWNCKPRPVEHEQYCKKYKKDADEIMEKRRFKAIYCLEAQIKEYEDQNF